MVLYFIFLIYYFKPIIPTNNNITKKKKEGTCSIVEFLILCKHFYEKKVPSALHRYSISFISTTIETGRVLSPKIS